MGKKDDDDDEWPSWDGVRGSSFLLYSREMRPSLASSYAGSTEPFSSLSVCDGQDEGGDVAGAPLLPGGAGAPAAQARRNKRQSVTWTRLIKTQGDKRVKTLLLALPVGDVPNPAGGPGFQGVGRRAWLLLMQEGNAPLDDEFINSKLTIFNNATILKSVGYGEGSITALNRFLNETVYLVPAARQPSDNDRTVRVLECVKGEAPSELALEATKEIKALGPARRFVLPAAPGTPVGQLCDLQATLQYFSEMWDVLVRDKKISVRPPTNRDADVTTLVSRGDGHKRAEKRTKHNSL